MKEYTFYPGCSSEKGASAANMENSVHAMCQMLGIKLHEIDDWNCCSASIGYAGGGELPRMALSARNFALAKKQFGNRDLVATCAACWLGMRETHERLEEDQQVKADLNEALQAAGLSYDGGIKTRHMVEVLIEDFGFDALKAKVTKPLTGIKVAGYVGCQTNRPFGVAGDNFENPQYLDKMTEACGATAVPFEKKVACCGGALAFSENEKSCALIRDILQSAVDNGADVISTPCPVCQLNVEVYQDKVNKMFGTRFRIPVVYYSQLFVLAWGGGWQKAALHQQVVPADVLKKFA
ncbi:MAG: CoB--CoM heterodisulfide reductase iron-sulfur subunit B family protein [Magnetococcales bacterium]|nr:CoB--CoM heterodisulfide reductase iron-sulfur subunit B family protein [Magnetococcales bacterium]MBF0155856.1 CoB--CoM heterodisulfide reductase iron-sulfur subunit B family protein [Magnetococcales bacterium]